MVAFLKKLASCSLLFMVAVAVQAQLLADNQTLNIQSVQRWMDSNRDMAAIVQVLDAMNTTDAELKTFDMLSAVEQDKKIDLFLADKGLLEAASSIAKTHGWQTVGEYMRLSTRLGNAIAAYFIKEDLGKLTQVQSDALRSNTDPAVLAVPEADIQFVIANEKLLQAYIQAYRSGRQ